MKCVSFISSETTCPPTLNKTSIKGVQYKSLMNNLADRFYCPRHHCVNDLPRSLTSVRFHSHTGNTTPENRGNKNDMQDRAVNVSKKCFVQTVT